VLHPEDEALVALGQALVNAGYSHVAVSPESHRRVNARPASLEAATLPDVFGWSRPFSPSLLGDDWLDLMRAANVLEKEGQLFRSSVRFASVAGQLFVHDAFPATSADAVEISADTYRWVSLVTRSVSRAERAVELKCGAGVGCLSLGQGVLAGVLADGNPRALRFARVNARLTGNNRVEVTHSHVLADVPGVVDLVLIHRQSAALDGPGFGIDEATEWVKEALARLPSGGRLLMYGSTPVVRGRDVLLEHVQPVLEAYDVRYEYLELDPDADSHRLDRPALSQVDRIARVGLSVAVPHAG